MAVSMQIELLRLVFGPDDLDHDIFGVRTTAAGVLVGTSSPNA